MQGFNALLIGALIGGAILLIGIVASPARDLGQWNNTEPQIKHWYQGLMQPDTDPPISCCGEGDAYWADEAVVEDGGKIVVAIITDDRDDAPLGRMHENIGARYVIPPNKITWKDGNPTGHVVLFLSYPTLSTTGGQIGTRRVLCYVMGSGT